MNLQLDPTKLAENEYALGVNIRNRSSSVDTIKKALQNENLPAGKYQGLYAVGNFAVLFISGELWIKNYYYTKGPFIQVTAFNMSPTADQIWAELVPSSSLNFERLPKLEDGETEFNATGEIKLLETTFPSPPCLVIQDGINRPFVMFADGSVRRLGTYYDWTLDNREYVPIGKMMLFSNGVLYIVSPDKSDGTGGDEIYRSVSGRPLDFMVNITSPAGDRLPLEVDGGASSVSHRVSYDKITCLHGLTVDDGSIFVSTTQASYRIIPDFDITIFGEPTFDTIFLFSTGLLNNNSFIDLTGDSAFIDVNGIRSFNAVLQSKNEGRNLPFSAKISPVFGDVNNPIIQSTTAAVEFNDYALFSVTTIYGPVIVVFDTINRLREEDILGVFVGLDVDPSVKLVKQFAQIKVNGLRKLIFITSDNKFFDAFEHCETAQAYLYPREWTTGNAKIEQKVSYMTIVVSDPREVGYMTSQLFVDGKKDVSAVESVVERSSNLTLPVVVPFGESLIDKVKNLAFNFDQGKRGWKAGVLISWNFDSSIVAILTEAEIMSQHNTEEQQALKYAGVSPNLSLNVCVSPSGEPEISLINVPPDDVPPDCVPPILTFFPAAGTEVSYPTYAVIASSDPLASVYYTLNGDTPSSESTLYTEPILLTDNTIVLKAIGILRPSCIGVVHEASYTNTLDNTGRFGFAYLCVDTIDRAGDFDDPSDGFAPNGVVDHYFELIVPIIYNKIIKRIEIFETTLAGIVVVPVQAWATNSPIEIVELGVATFAVYPLVIFENNTQLFTSYQSTLNISTNAQHLFTLFGQPFMDVGGFFKVKVVFSDDTTLTKIISHTCTEGIIPFGSISSNDYRVCIGETITVSWNVSGKDIASVEITPDIGTVGQSGSVDIVVDGNKNYTLIAYDSLGNSFTVGSINIVAVNCYECPGLPEDQLAGFVGMDKEDCTGSVDITFVGTGPTFGQLAGTNGYVEGVGYQHPNVAMSPYLDCIRAQVTSQAQLHASNAGRTFVGVLCASWQGAGSGTFGIFNDLCDENRGDTVVMESAFSLFIAYCYT